MDEFWYISLATSVLLQEAKTSRKETAVKIFLIIFSSLFLQGCVCRWILQTVFGFPPRMAGSVCVSYFLTVLLGVLEIKPTLSLQMFSPYNLN